MANYDQKEYLRRIISDALQGEAQESEYSMNEEQAGEQYKIAKADYEAFRKKYSIKNVIEKCRYECRRAMSLRHSLYKNHNVSSLS